jgi:glutathione synthase/RimK-type ligase-like ATP-grasp enzyme
MRRVVVLTDSRYAEQRMPYALVDALRGRGCPAVVAQADQLVAEVRPHGGAATDPVQDSAAALDGLRPYDLLVPRTRNPFALSLLCRAQLDGVRAVNRWEAIQAVRDKPYAALVLAEADVPAPRTFLTDRPMSLAALPASAWPVLVKPPYGDNGRGIVRVDSPRGLDRLDWPEGMVLAQSYIDVAGADLKLYGAGEEVWAVRRLSPLLALADCGAPVPVPVTDGLRDLAHACRDAFGLELYGVDVLPSPDGPLVVDVNDFPNYTGVTQAPEALADLVESRLKAVAVP